MISEFFLEIMNCYLNKNTDNNIFEILKNIISEFFRFFYFFLKPFNAPSRRFFSKHYIQKNLYMFIPAFRPANDFAIGAML